MPGSLEGRTALVTGGAKRIGRAISLALASSGADVVVHYGSSRAEADATAAGCRDAGVQAWTVEADLADPEQAGRLYADAQGIAGSAPDLLVNNASAFPERRFTEAAAPDLDAMMHLHAWAPWTLMRNLAAALHGGRDGAVVNLLDTRIASQDPLHLPYWVSKQALGHLTRAAALELAPAVRVNAVAPGPILPPPGKDEAHMQRAKEAVPMARLGTPEEVADAVRFLLEADYVTGHTLFVDGGRHLRG